jgi:hypothetical protein
LVWLRSPSTISPAAIGCAQNQAAIAQLNGGTPNKPHSTQQMELKHMTLKNTVLARTPSLVDRIKQIRADIDAVIDAKAEAVAKQSPGVPLGVIRNLLTARAPTCPCTQYLEITEGRGSG